MLSVSAAFGNMPFGDWLQDADSTGWVRAASAALKSTPSVPASHIDAAQLDIRAPMLEATDRATHAQCAVGNYRAGEVCQPDSSSPIGTYQ